LWVSVQSLLHPLPVRFPGTYGKITAAGLPAGIFKKSEGRSGVAYTQGPFNVLDLNQRPAVK
jgi:hypothetical protein